MLITNKLERSSIESILGLVLYLPEPAQVEHMKAQS